MRIETLIIGIQNTCKLHSTYRTVPTVKQTISHSSTQQAYTQAGTWRLMAAWADRVVTTSLTWANLPIHSSTSIRYVIHTTNMDTVPGQADLKCPLRWDLDLYIDLLQTGEYQEQISCENFSDQLVLVIFLGGNIFNEYKNKNLWTD